MIDRRAFLKSSGVSLLFFGAGSIAGPPFLARAAMAIPDQAARRRKVLVAIFQRGAMDGLAAVPPLTEQSLLAKLRPRLAMTGARTAAERDRTIDLGCGFGLHPALQPFEPLWKEGRLAVVHQVGSPDPTRSHFDAQDYSRPARPGARARRRVGSTASAALWATKRRRFARWR